MNEESFFRLYVKKLCEGADRWDPESKKKKMTPVSGRYLSNNKAVSAESVLLHEYLHVTYFTHD